MTRKDDYTPTASIGDEGIEWIHGETPKAYQPFPLDELPEPLRSLVTEGAAAINCDPMLILMPLLSTVGAAIGNARSLVIKEGWAVFACIWTMVIAESGTAKTPAFKLAKGPMEALEEEAHNQFDAEERQYDSESAEYERAKKRFDKSSKGDTPIEPVAPVPRRHIVKDTTLAALVEILRGNSRGLLVLADELAGWFGSFNKHDNGGGDAEQWLSIYSGESISVDRKGERNQRGVMRPIRVRTPFAAITGGIQPGRFAETITQKHQASGMAARFLMAYPPRAAKRWSDREVSLRTRESYASVVASLVAMEGTLSVTMKPEPKFIGMNREAKKLYQAFYNRHNESQIERDGTVAAASSKIEEIPARLALIIHCVKLASGAVSLDKVDAESMRSAIAMADWFMAEAERIYDIMGGNVVARHSDEVLQWINQHGGRITASELAKGRRDIAGSDDADSTLNRLVKFGWGTWEPKPPGKTGGRPTRVFVANPVGETPLIPEESIGYADTPKGEQPETADDDDVGEERF